MASRRKAQARQAPATKYQPLGPEWDSLITLWAQATRRIALAEQGHQACLGHVTARVQPAAKTKHRERPRARTA
jgi:hypothetical protein